MVLLCGGALFLLSVHDVAGTTFGGMRAYSMLSLVCVCACVRVHARACVLFFSFATGAAVWRRVVLTVYTQCS